MWTNSKCSADLVTITEEIFKGKLHFQCNDKSFENFTKNRETTVRSLIFNHIFRVSFVDWNYIVFFSVIGKHNFL